MRTPAETGKVTSLAHKRKRQISLTLTYHPRGYWCKQIDGKLCYFGQRGGSEEDARRELIAFLHHRENDQLPGRANAVAVHSLAAAYEAYYAGRVAAGHVAARTWADYQSAIEDFVAIVGPKQIAARLSASAFSRVAGEWRVLSPARRGNYIQTVRSMFRWAKLDVDFGPDFVKPDRSEYRSARRRAAVREIPADVLAVCWRYAGPRLRAWLLLGLNCGMYAADVSRLTWGDIREVDGVLCVDWLRGKTGIPWIAPLWPETVASLPNRRRDAVAVFATKGGLPLVRNRTDEVAATFERLLDKAGLKQRGLAFGAVRHTHTTAVQQDGADADAACIVRGHRIAGMAELYDNVDRHIARLKRVTDAARVRLFVAPSSIEIPKEVAARFVALKPGPKPRRAPSP